MECHPERLLHSQGTASMEWVLQIDLQQVNPCARELPESWAVNVGVPIIIGIASTCSYIKQECASISDEHDL